MPDGPPIALLLRGWCPRIEARPLVNPDPEAPCGTPVTTPGTSGSLKLTGSASRLRAREGVTGSVAMSG